MSKKLAVVRCARGHVRPEFVSAQLWQFLLPALGSLVCAHPGEQWVWENMSSFAIDFNNGNLSLINSNASTCPTAVRDPQPCGLPLNILLDPPGANGVRSESGSCHYCAAFNDILRRRKSMGVCLRSPRRPPPLPPAGYIPIAMTRDCRGTVLVCDRPRGRILRRRIAELLPPSYPISRALPSRSLPCSPAQPVCRR